MSRDCVDARDRCQVAQLSSAAEMIQLTGPGICLKGQRKRGRNRPTKRCKRLDEFEVGQRESNMSSMADRLERSLKK